MSIVPTREDKAHNAGFSEGLRMAALEIDTLTQQRDELAAALKSFSLVAQRIDAQRGIIFRLTNNRDILTACEVIAEYLNAAADSTSDPAAILREHDERVTAELTKELLVLKKQLEGLTPGGPEFVDDPQRCLRWIYERLTGPLVKNGAHRIAELEQQLAAFQLREKGYREALEKIAEEYSLPGMKQKICSGREDWDIARAALAQPSDDKVLEAYVAERTKELITRAGQKLAKRDISLYRQIDEDRYGFTYKSIPWERVIDAATQPQQVATPDAERDLPAAQNLQEQVNEKSEVMLFAARKLRHLAADFECAPQHQPTDIQSRLKGIALWLESCCYGKQEAAPDALRAARKDGSHPKSVCGHIGCDCYEEAAPDA